MSADQANNSKPIRRPEDVPQQSISTMVEHWSNIQLRNLLSRRATPGYRPGHCLAGPPVPGHQPTRRHPETLATGCPPAAQTPHRPTRAVPDQPAAALPGRDRLHTPRHPRHESCARWTQTPSKSTCSTA